MNKKLNEKPKPECDYMHIVGQVINHDGIIHLMRKCVRALNHVGKHRDCEGAEWESKTFKADVGMDVGTEEK